MKINSFEEIISWKKACLLTEKIYKEFKFCDDFGFRDQIQRASISIMNNIAEGFERKSDKEFKNFLFIAKGSCGELRSMFYIANRVGFINKSNYKTYLSDCFEISKLLSGLIKTL